MRDKGTFRQYEDVKFKPATLALIGHMAGIVERYEEKGLTMSVRQVFYQLVQSNYLPNSEASYDKVQQVLSRARLAGLISWTALEDRTRFLRGLQHWDGPSAALRDAASSYRADLWADQAVRPEVWIEKDALVGVIGGICQQLRVDFFACRGYNSQSEQWRAGRRLAGYVQRGQRPIVVHLGDHDPSGLDMTRDNQERLSLFAGVPIQVTRIALNRSQVDELRLPPNPAKQTDARFADYQRDHGDESWELDALPPDYMSRIIEDTVLQFRDQKKWDAALAQEVEDKQHLRDLAGGEET